jgi:hypothetical protein
MAVSVRRLGGPTSRALFIISQMESAWGPDESAAHRAHLVVRELAREGLLPGTKVVNGLAVDATEYEASGQCVRRTTIVGAGSVVGFNEDGLRSQ